MGPIPARRLAGVLTALAVALALLSGGEARWALEGLARLFGALIISTSTVLGACVHRSPPERHDRPEDFGGLMTEGPYSVVRHPFYLTMILDGLEAAVYSLSTGVLMLALVSGPSGRWPPPWRSRGSGSGGRRRTPSTRAGCRCSCRSPDIEGATVGDLQVE